jgi:hypothetical protein
MACCGACHAVGMQILATASHFKWDENCVIHITMPTPKLGHRITRFLRRFVPHSLLIQHTANMNTGEGIEDPY